jgi:hypothetical protein
MRRADVRRARANLVGACVKIYLLLAVAIAGCGKSAEQCKLEAEAFGKQLAEADTEIAVWTTKVKLPVRRDVTHRELRMAPVVTVVRGGFTYGYDDRPITREELREELRKERERALESIARNSRFAKNYEPRMVYFVIDESVPWSEVVAAVELAADVELTMPVFLFAVPATWTPPPRAPIDDELDRIANAEPGDRATKFAQIISQLVEDCPAMVTAFGQVGSEESRSKAQILIEAIPPALIDCNCKVPMDDFRSAIWRVMVPAQPMRAIVLDPGAPAEPLALPAAMTWGEASKRLAPTTKNARFEVR